MFIEIFCGALLSLYTLVSAADNFANSLDPGQARRNIRPDLDTNCLTLKEFSEKVDFEKISRRQKSMKNFLEGKELEMFCGAHLRNEF